MSTHWYVLRVKPHKERMVSQMLSANSIVHYFPVLHVKPVNPRAVKVRPYFPGYMFVQTDLDELGEHTFRWLPGAEGLVRYGDTPAVVPDSLIYEVKKRLAAIEAAGGLVLSRIKPGDRVRVVDGPFAGYEAIFDAYLSGKERVRVLLAFLGNREIPLTLNVNMINLA